MLMDTRTEFANDAALSTAGTSAVAVGSQIDLLAPGATVVNGISTTTDIPGNSNNIYLCIKIGTVAPDSGTPTSTVKFELVSDSNVNLTTAPVVHLATDAIAHETLVAGYKVAVYKLPLGDYKRYLGIRQVASAQLTQGKFSAWLTPNPPTWKATPDAL